jgi:hypothetical protein
LALAALISASREPAEAGVSLRATLPLAGRTLIERQARLAAAAGASPIIVHVERMPGDLAGALERMRRDRLPVIVARSAEEAAEAVDPFDRVLLIADGAVADATQLARLAGMEGPAVLTVPDSAFDDRFERIDAVSRWAGFAAIDGVLLRETAGMLHDWDLQSTLLRRALQAGARHVAAEGAIGILDCRADLGALEQRILQSAETGRRGWASRLLAPVERALTAMFMSGPVTPQMIGLGAAVTTALGAGAMLRDYFWLGLPLLLIATPLDGVAVRLARLRMQDGLRQGWWFHLLPVLMGAALLALGYRLVPAHGWGTVVVALAAILFLLALGLETEGRKLKGDLLLAEPKGMIWLMLPFAAFGRWEAGLAVLFAYAAASFFWAQHQVHATGTPEQD